MTLGFVARAEKNIWMLPDMHKRLPIGKFFINRYFIFLQKKTGVYISTPNNTCRFEKTFFV